VKFRTILLLVLGIGRKINIERFKEPVKGKNFRKRFRNYGFNKHLISEFRTRCKCSHCQHGDGKHEPFRMRLDPNKKNLEINGISTKYTVYWLANSAVCCGIDMLIPWLTLLHWRESTWMVELDPSICVDEQAGKVFDRSVTSTFNKVGNPLEKCVNSKSRESSFSP